MLAAGVDSSTQSTKVVLCQAGDGTVIGRGPAWWASETGRVPNAAFTVTKLHWLAGHEPGHAARTASVMLPHGWLTWRSGRPSPVLTGAMPPAPALLTCGQPVAPRCGHRRARSCAGPPEPLPWPRRLRDATAIWEEGITP